MIQLEPLALVFIYHKIITSDEIEVELATWTVGKTVDDCVRRWNLSHKGVTPSRIHPAVIPKDKF